MRDVVLDIETNGLLEEATVLHSLVVRCVDTGEVVSCAEQPGYLPFSEGLRVLQRARRVYGHNIIGFDRPALAKLTGYEIPWEKVRDTLVIAGFRWTNLRETDPVLVRKGKLPPKFIGMHSLEAWGYRLGVLKDDFGTSGETDWSTWSPEMQSYCEQDTAVNAALVHHIRRAGAIPNMSIETEQELAEYLRHQEHNGWPVDMEKAIELQARLAHRRQELEEELKRIFGYWFEPETKHGKVVVHTPRVDNRKRGVAKGCPFTKVKLVHFNPASRQHIAKRLQKLYGWKPSTFTPGGQPEVSEETLKSLPQDLPGIPELVEYLLLTKRLGQLAEGKNAWLKLADNKRAGGGVLTGMQHIHGRVLQSGTITHRASHFLPNLAQVPRVGKPFGEECRSLFTVPDGWVQIGADASGLELRMLSHYMAPYDGGAYGTTVVEGRNEDGTDVHSVNRDALGLEGKEGRDDAKTFIYAFLYGSGDLNLGQLIGCSRDEVDSFKTNKKEWARAKKLLRDRDQPTDDYTVACLIKGGTLRGRFLKNIPALSSLIEDVKKAAKDRGWLKLIDGRRVPVRFQHAALNSLLQGSGSIVCKRWIVRFNRRLVSEFGPQGWGGKWAALGWIHDEVQLAVRPEIAPRVAQILIEEIRAVGVEFNLRVPLDGEAKIGRNWAETH